MAVQQTARLKSCELICRGDLSVSTTVRFGSSKRILPVSLSAISGRYRQIVRLSAYLSGKVSTRPAISEVSAKDAIPRQTWIQAPGTATETVGNLHMGQQDEWEKAVAQKI
jgi:hypothetical protein